MLDKQINHYLKELHLPTVKSCYAEQADLARQDSLSYEQYLLELIVYSENRDCHWKRHWNLLIANVYLPELILR